MVLNIVLMKMVSVLVHIQARLKKNILTAEKSIAIIKMVLFVLENGELKVKYIFLMRTVFYTDNRF